MARIPLLTYDRGTLILHPPPRGNQWIEFATWDDRIEKFRIPAHHYRPLVEQLRQQQIAFQDEARQFGPLAGLAPLQQQPYAHQQEALAAWIGAGRRGVVVLPTGAGKSFLAQMALESTGRTALVVVPTLDLMHQWYTQLRAVFPAAEVGLLGGGSRDRSPLLIATYDSAAIQAETLGNGYGLLIFDECHHLPSDFNRVIAEYSLAPYRLGLTATPDRSDGRHGDLEGLIGPEVYHRQAADLSGIALADYEVRQIKVQLSAQERQRYGELIALRNQFLQDNQLSLGGLGGWQRFIQVSARSSAGRQAMLAHHQAKAIALGTAGKLKVLEDLLVTHDPEQVLIFTNDNATVYTIAQDFLIPAITHQTPVKERHEILTLFRQGIYRSLVVANVLDEGVDVPDVRLAIFLAGSGSTRQFIQRLGRVLRRGKDGTKQAILYEVVAEDTVEEGSSQRRRKSRSPGSQSGDRRGAAGGDRQLYLVPPPSGPQVPLAPVPGISPTPALPQVADRSAPYAIDPDPDLSEVDPSEGHLD